MMPNETAAANPFPGLRPFDVHENHLFFGRDGQSDELLRRLAQRRFIAVVGTSGSGKSSLVRAGLLPSLHGGFMIRAGSGWRVTIFRPGSDPIGNLAAALNRPEVLGGADGEQEIHRFLMEASLRRSALGLADVVRQARMPARQNLLVVVDQFEELFRFKNAEGAHRSEDDAAAFVKLLLEAGRQREVPVYVIITMRSDFLGDCAQFRDLPETINEGLYLLPRMTRDQRRDAITGPVAVGGAEITPRLVNRLLNDVGDNPDQLPLLQHSLMRTWQQWAAGGRAAPLDLPNYESVGGMAEALSRHADKAYEELSTERLKRIAERLFKLLTERGQDNREIRRPTRLEEICAVAEAGEDEVRAVIESFRREGRSFLVPPADVALHPGSLIDITHESLIRGWQRLRGWVDDEALSARIYRRLAETAALHRAGEAGLWRDPDLSIALAWRDKHRPNPAWGARYSPDFDAAMSFLEESRRARDAERLERARQRRNTLRLTQALALILLLGLCASLALGYFFYQQRMEALALKSRAEASARQAEENARRAEANARQAEENAQRAEQAETQALAEQERAVRESELARAARDEAKRRARETSVALRVAEAAKQEAQDSARRAAENALEATLAKLRAEQKEEAVHDLAFQLRRRNLEHNSQLFKITNRLAQESAAHERPRWLLESGYAQASMNNHDEAIERFTRVLEDDPNNFEALATRASQYLLLKMPRQAVEDADRALRLRNDHALTYLNKSRGQGLLGLYKDARQTLGRSIETFKYLGHSEYADYKVEDEIHRATGQKIIYADKGAVRAALDYEMADLAALEGSEDSVALVEKVARSAGPRAAYVYALNWSLANYKARPADYGTLVLQGVLWERAKFEKEAGRAFVKFKCEHERRRDPRYAALMKWAAKRLRELRLEGAGCPSAEPPPETPDRRVLTLEALEVAWSGRADTDKLLTRAITANPEDADSWLNRGIFRYAHASGDYVATKADLQVAIDKGPDTALAYLYRALAHAREGAPAEQIMPDVLKAKSLNPGAVPSSTMSGDKSVEVLVEKIAGSTPREALDLLERYAKYNLPSAQPYYQMARLLRKTGQYGEALARIKVAIAMKGDSLEFYEERARVEEERLRAEGARGGGEGAAARLLEVRLSKALGYREAGDVLSKSGRAGEALHAYGESLKALDELARQNGAEGFRCEAEAGVDKIVRLILAQKGSTKDDVLAFMQTVLGDLKGIGGIVQDRTKRVLSAP